MSTPDPNEEFRTAATRKLDRLERRITELAATVCGTQARGDEFAQQLAHLAGDIAQLAAMVSAQSESARPVSWLAVGSAQDAEELLHGLARWVTEVFAQYPGVELPDCWFRHPPAVEELLVLWQMYERAYGASGSGGSWQLTADWHDRYRPATTKRLNDAIGKCAPSMHDSGRAAGQSSYVRPAGEDLVQEARKQAEKQSGSE